MVKHGKEPLKQQEDKPLHHHFMGYSFQLTARDLLYTPI